MLRALSIQNFILIDNLLIEFYNGLTALTGETGAGKSIILDALGLSIGNRANLSLIKNKEKPAIISAEFDISLLNQDIKQNLTENYGIEGTDLVLKRVINFDGKSRAFINNSISSVSQLKALANYFIEVCGQHDQHGLFDESEHLLMLDEYFNLKTKKLELKKLFTNYQNKKIALVDLIDLKNKSLEEKSYLEYIIAEIEDIGYRPGEEEELEVKKKKLASLEKLKELSSLIQLKLSGEINGVLVTLYTLQKALVKVPEYFDGIYHQINEAVIILEEVVRQNSDLISSDDYQMTLNEVEGRLFKIKNLARKYSIVPSQIPEFLSAKRSQYQLIENIDDKIIDAEKLLTQVKKEYFDYALMISSQREEAARNLKANIISQFQDIKMDKADFSIEIKDKTEDKWSADGIDEVRFLIKTNPGMPFGVINNIASGGELSRIMLACKIALYKNNFVPVMIFDEIDSGISGSVSTSVGRKLAELSKLGQILIVTHQPQVAVFANRHYLVTKQEAIAEQVEVKVNLLNEQERLKEIARMLSGDHITTEAENAAKSLFEKVPTL
ncbi:MAG: DNA repair protein RecN [Candidatus Midichloria sp.]|nr:DNA repair protein RecN [Candidatus Midichloria sp.]